VKNLLKKLKNNQAFWFSVIGGINTALDFIILFVLTSLGVKIFIANIFSTGTTFIISFLMNKKITFKSVSNIFIIITLFGLWVIQNIVISTAMPIFENLLKNKQMSLLLSKLIATIFSLIWNFILYKKVVFKK